VCVCNTALVICKLHLLCAVLYCHLRPALLYHIFPNFLIQCRILGKNLLNTKCVLIFSTTSVWKISHLKNNSLRHDDKCTYIHHVSYPLFLSDFNKTLILLTDFQEVLTYKISCKSVQWEPSYSMRTDRWTEMKLTVTFRSFVNMPKHWCALHQQITLFFSASWFCHHILCILLLCTH
jgi:hypothetical protein